MFIYYKFLDIIILSI